MGLIEIAVDTHQTGNIDPCYMFHQCHGYKGLKHGWKHIRICAGEKRRTLGWTLNVSLSSRWEGRVHREGLKCYVLFLHTATAIPFIYSFPGNCAASAPVSPFMCLWAIYIFPGSVHIFPPAKKTDPSWECGNWDWGPDIPFLGIFVSNFRHFVFAVHLQTS